MIEYKQFVSKTLQQFRYSEFTLAFKSWTGIDSRQLSFIENAILARNFSKHDTIRRIAEYCETENVKSSEIGNLDILYMQKYNKRKLWTAFELVGKAEQETNVNRVKNTLRRQLSTINLSTIVSTLLGVGLLWIRIEILDEKGSSTVYHVAHLLNTKYMAIAGGKAFLHAQVHQCLKISLGTEDIEELFLKGPCVNSLLMLCLNKEGKETAQKYNQILQSKLRRKRKVTLDENVEDEDSEKWKMREEHIEKKFGPYVQPKLEAIELNAEMELMVPSLASKMKDHQTKNSLTLHGTNVLEGVREMVSAGIITPHQARYGFWSKIHTSGLNSFTLKKKKARPKDMDSSAASGV